ncbi:hypothetical protein ATY41_02990 [Leifsonia xyli subsp. xyli]|nr:GntR family transcriptional regulator [Leifsonia xyli]ODA90019.1 hypothetical protein ATY41_02990 [Leifsonia xyli subsp. xyli]
MPIPNDQPEQHHRVLLRDMVRERIRDAIMDGTLRPGEDLRDEELQAWLGVSRTPIRDAVNELTRAGLIEMAPNRYTRVATPSEEEALTSYNTLGVVLAGVVRLAVPKLPDSARKSILSELRKLAEAARGGDFDSVRDLFIPVFSRYIEHCENPQLVQLCHDTLDGLSYKMRTERMRTLVDQQELAASIERLREATASGSAVEAELATGLVFLLPA